ncbi:MAG: hypothetical protein ACHP8B_03160 [Terriglobales bacterium]
MSLFKRGRFWHFEFQVNGTRYRGSTKQATQTRARQIEVHKMQEAQENGYTPLPKKAPILRDFAAAVLKTFNNIHLMRTPSVITETDGAASRTCS